MEILVKVGIINRALSRRKSEGVELRIGGRKWREMDRQVALAGHPQRYLLLPVCCK